MKRFLKRAALFVLLFVAMTAALEAKLRATNRQTDGRYRIGEDVYQVLQSAEIPHDQVTTLYLGDSVARQLFHLRTEPSPDLLYLPSNQAISLAGQYCILQTVAQRCPHLNAVYFFYSPHSWSNNLDQVFTHDYFCGYFHSPAMVWEVWQLKHDPQLLAAHVGRMILPNIMAENSYLNRSQSPSGVPLAAPNASPRPPYSRVSEHFLEKMKQFCQQHGINLTVLPCPCFGQPAQTLAVLRTVYDAPIRQYDPALFEADHIHVKNVNMPMVRAEVMADFRLPMPLPVARP